MLSFTAFRLRALLSSVACGVRFFCVWCLHLATTSDLLVFAVCGLLPWFVSLVCCLGWAVVVRCFCSVIVVCLGAVVLDGVTGACILAYDGTSGCLCVLVSLTFCGVVGDAFGLFGA